MRSSTGKAHYIIEEVVGCGPFQAILIFVIHFLSKCAVTFTMTFMAFGIYNPGWKCLDSNVTQFTSINNTDHFNEYSLNGRGIDPYHSNESHLDNCPLFEKCQNIQFDPYTSTIVSEWGLLCGKAWIPRFIISLQMAGVLVGSAVVGQLGDSIGRKKTIFGSQLMLILMGTMTIFSQSWQMFASLRFFMGMSCASLLSLYHVFLAEFSTYKWRAGINAVPSWSINSIWQSLLIMALKDWRYVHIVTVVIATIGFIPVIWVSESLRWLEVKEKHSMFMEVARKMAKMNGKPLPPTETLLAVKSETLDSRDGEVYTVLDLFRRGYRIQTLLLGLMWFSASLMYYGINFGIKSLDGNFYLNFIVMSSCEMPLMFVPLVAPNYLGRKVSGIGLVGIVTVCFFTSVGFLLSPLDHLRTVGVTVLIILAKAFVIVYWSTFSIHAAEIFPTVVRSLGLNWCSLLARIGGITAPFLIPKDPGTKYICYAVMGALGLFSCLAILQLPETKGKTLKETFDDNSDVINDETTA